jgi:hypothetical protein
MRWTKRQKEKMVTRLLGTATLAIIAVGVVVAVASILHFRV